MDSMMQTKQDFRCGILFRREHPPEKLPDFAVRAEEAGFDELWVVEDCFYASGIASVAAALACTDSIAVGLGIMPAVVRNAVFTAMELATLARLYPGRFLPGIGHGVAGWMRQIGAMPKSQLVALEEAVVAVRGLLAGEKLSFQGDEVWLDQAQLVHPPEEIPPVSLGVRGPKSLALSGRVADGTILAEYAAPAFVAWAREQVGYGQQAAGVDRPHRLTVLALTCVDQQTANARRQLRPLLAPALASGKIDAQIAPLGILPAVREFRENGGVQRLEAEMPDEWIDRLAVVGTAAECDSAIRRLVEAGADTVVLVPLPGKDVAELELLARLLPPQASQVRAR
jgi:alkanesulfonate monooxygenase SsuD/methylene tetrahydromethanopterin reductase-like flavin-dependent oxidoreductase (luciferase family)